ncbi:GspH/FimT family pseudopilin [Hydrogenophaga sp. RWCD_12]|uniref:GspH/FimT family pseudopilin n=1 Tax=Hydrogenophaga sp. RWCD_12 TaxID=3391190 RepID=UPI00398541F7
MKHPSYPTQPLPAGQRGFTILELVITLTLVGILTAVMAPTFGETLRNWRRDSATRALNTTLLQGRAEAIKSTRKVMVCPTTTGTSCANSTEWKTGWMMFVDDGATDQAYDAGERILQVTTAQGGIASLASSSGVRFLQFWPNGLMFSTAAAGTAHTTFTVTPSGLTSSTKVDKIAVSRVGRATVTTDYP